MKGAKLMSCAKFQLNTKEIMFVDRVDFDSVYLRGLTFYLLDCETDTQI